MGLFDFFKKKSEGAIVDFSRKDSNDLRDMVHAGVSDEELLAEYEKRTNQTLDASADFCMEVGDVFTITGRGTVVTGTIASGEIAVGDKVIVERRDGSTIESVVNGIEMFRKLLDKAQAGDNVGLLLKNLQRNDVNKGDILKKI